MHSRQISPQFNAASRCSACFLQPRIGLPFLVIFCLFLCASGAHAQVATANGATNAAANATTNSANEQAGIIKVVRGDVQVQRRSSASAQAAKVGDRVFAGDRLITAADAAAGITLRDDTLMSLGPKSSFVLEQYNFDADAGDGNVAVRVLKGTLRYVTGLIGKHAPDHQQVLTPTATIGIRGTDFIVEVVSND